MLAEGTIVAGYRVDGVLGQGGMAVVYRATQLSLNRTIALKLLSSELSDDPNFRERFRREGQVQAGLDHNHIVPVYEAGDTEFGLFLAMRLIVGSTLKELILAGALEPRRTLRILAQVSQALDVAHDAGLIHRDIKPQNILIGQGDQVYLADFGLIKSSSETSLTSPGQFMGTIDYVAPEQIQGQAASSASDCYALSAVLYECLTGTVPFPHSTEAATLRDHIVTAPPKITASRPDLPSALDDVIASGMAKDPAQRPSSASELVKMAARALGTGDASGAEAATTQVGQPTRITGGDGEPTVRSGVPASEAVAYPAGATRITGQPVLATLDQAAPATASAAAAPAAAARDRPRRTAPVLIGVVVAVVLALVGYLVGHPARTRSAVFTNSATAGALQLRFPSDWQTGGPAGGIPGLTLDSSARLTDGHGTSLVAGIAPDAGNPTLLPTALRGRIGGRLPAPATVSIGSLRAERYSDLTVKGMTGTVTLFVLPTAAGVATIGCVSPVGSAAAASRCAQIADTLQLNGTRALPLGSSPAYAHALNRVLAHLHTAIGAPSRALTAARTPAAQAAAADRLAAAFAAAHTAAAQLAAPPQAQQATRALVTALAAVHADYAAAATAAHANAGAAYRRASAHITRDTALVNAGLASLARAGYTVTR